MKKITKLLALLLIFGCSNKEIRKEIVGDKVFTYTSYNGLFCDTLFVTDTVGKQYFKQTWIDGRQQDMWVLRDYWRKMRYEEFKLEDGVQMHYKDDNSDFFTWPYDSLSELFYSRHAKLSIEQLSRNSKTSFYVQNAPFELVTIGILGGTNVGSINVKDKGFIFKPTKLIGDTVRIFSWLDYQNATFAVNLKVK